MDLAELIQTNEAVLIKQSRSFSIPILNLDDSLKVPIMVQYNLNKTIDTIEDTANLTVQEKIAAIQTFCQNTILNKESTALTESLIKKTPKDEAYVFAHHPSVFALFEYLTVNEQRLAKKWLLEMGDGMCSFLQRSVESMKDLNEYCYYVAGSVGVYLTELLVSKSPTSVVEPAVRDGAIHFGLFLQKLNIIRDFYEDKNEKKRMFWPQSLFKEAGSDVDVLNFLCQETLENDFPKALRYSESLAGLNTSFDSFIRFILYSGIAYLKLLFNNHNIFAKTKVKLPKALIKSLYKDVASLQVEAFIDKCQQVSRTVLNA